MDFGSQLSLQTHAFSSPALRQITLDVQKVNGVNLGQGVCNLPVPELILDRAAQAAQDGINRYTNPRGLQSLREAIGGKLRHFNQIDADHESSILITCGATGAFEAVCATLVNPGDEVVVFEPSYPYHMTALKRYQANVKVLSLQMPDWDIDFDALRDAVSARTKFILVNTPGNPTGKIFTREALDEIAKIIEPTNCMLVTDEIYEYMTFDGRSHLSPGSLPRLRDRTVTIGGYSKTFSITGWRIGYMVVPPSISAAMTSFLDAVYVCAPAPLQQAVADGILSFDDQFYRDLNTKYESKRNRFAIGLEKIGLTPFSPAGAYYMICSFERSFPDLSSGEFVQMMIRETGVGAVPSSDFVRDESKAKWVRFCLASDDSVLEDALQRLKSLPIRLA